MRERQGHRHYRRSKRGGGRVVAEHFARGELADLGTSHDAELRD